MCHAPCRAHRPRPGPSPRRGPRWTPAGHVSRMSAPMRGGMLSLHLRGCHSLGITNSSEGQPALKANRGHPGGCCGHGGVVRARGLSYLRTVLQCWASTVWVSSAGESPQEASACSGYLPCRDTLPLPQPSRLSVPRTFLSRVFSPCSN